MSDHFTDGRAFPFSSWDTAWDVNLPHIYLFLAFYGLCTGNKTLGSIAAFLGSKAYIETAQNYHLVWKGSTALFCFAYLYAAVKLLELAAVMLIGQEDAYSPVNIKEKSPTTFSEKCLWALRTSVNMRCIGLRCGKTEYPTPMPSKWAVLWPAMVKLTLVDMTTTSLHHLTVYNSNSQFIARPLWQQAAITLLTGFALFNVFQGTYGILQFIGIFLLGSKPSQWPPMSVEPWAATSVREFWSRKWHSDFRRIFTFFADLCLDPLLQHSSVSQNGRALLTVLAVFFMSALFHYAGLYLVLGLHSLRTILFFVLQGPAVLIEDYLGIRQRPLIGWLWTYAFLFLSGGSVGFVAFLVDTGAPLDNFFTDGFFKEFSVVSRVVNLIFGTTW